MTDWLDINDGQIRLACGDCLEILPTLEAGSVDACITDPPYGVNLGSTAGAGGKHGLKREAYDGFGDTMESFVVDVVPRLNLAISLAERSAVFTGPHIHEQKKPSAIGGVYCSAACGRHSWGFKNFLPVLLYGIAPDLRNGAKHPTAISSNESAIPNGHPCPKPESWMLWLCNLASLKGDTILDPFMGSGTTGVACVRTGRKFIGIEKERKYYDIAVDRITKELERHALFEDKPKIVQRMLL